MSDTDLRVAAIQDEARGIVMEKNGRYGSSWRHQGWRGNLSRVLEKSDRLRAMLWSGGTPLLNGEKEHPRETILDIMNTCAFMIANLDDGVEWGNEPQAAVILPEIFRTPTLPAQPTDPSRWVPDPSMGDALGEQTQVHAVVGDLATPGEERYEDARPSPTKRNQRRAVKDNPQA